MLKNGFKNKSDDEFYEKEECDCEDGCYKCCDNDEYELELTDLIDDSFDPDFMEDDYED